MTLPSSERRVIGAHLFDVGHGSTRLPTLRDHPNQSILGMLRYVPRVEGVVDKAGYYLQDGGARTCLPSIVGP